MRALRAGDCLHGRTLRRRRPSLAKAPSRSDLSRALEEGDMEYRAVTKYLGGDRAEVKIRDLTFTVYQRVSLWREGAKFCPIELILASLAS